MRAAEEAVCKISGSGARTIVKATDLAGSLLPEAGGANCAKRRFFSSQHTNGSRLAGGRERFLAPVEQLIRKVGRQMHHLGVVAEGQKFPTSGTFELAGDGGYIGAGAVGGAWPVRLRHHRQPIAVGRGQDGSTSHRCAIAAHAPACQARGQRLPSPRASTVRTGISQLCRAMRASARLHDACQVERVKCHSPEGHAEAWLLGR